MTNQPTPEQIEAAKAWCDGRHTQEHLDALCAFPKEGQGSRIARILLAALERAEADSARLEFWIEDSEYIRSFHRRVDEGRPDRWCVVEYEYPDEMMRSYPWADSKRAAIDAAASAQLDAGLNNAARKAQP